MQTHKSSLYVFCIYGKLDWKAANLIEDIFVFTTWKYNLFLEKNIKNGKILHFWKSHHLVGVRNFAVYWHPKRWKLALSDELFLLYPPSTPRFLISLFVHCVSLLPVFVCLLIHCVPRLWIGVYYCLHNVVRLLGYPSLKVPKREIFDRSDFPDFYTIKSSWVGDLVVNILTYYFNFWGSYAAFSFWRACWAYA